MAGLVWRLQREVTVRSSKKVSVQQVGSNTYRVNTRAGRSAITGHFVQQSTVKSHPKTTVNEVKDKS